MLRQPPAHGTVRRRSAASVKLIRRAVAAVYVSCLLPQAQAQTQTQTQTQTQAQTQAPMRSGQDVYNQGGASSAALACMACHGADALGMGSFPRLAGLPAAYIARQIGDFRSGARANAIMQPIASALTAEETEAVASFLSGLPAPKREPAAARAQAQGVGEALALRGDWSRDIPACVACHGPAGVGVGEAFPPLAGQPAEYLAAQLHAWRAGTRRNDPNDLMGHIARSLTDDEIPAVSKYFAGLGS